MAKKKTKKNAQAAAAAHQKAEKVKAAKATKAAKAAKKITKDDLKVNSKPVKWLGFVSFILLVALFVGAYFYMVPKNLTDIEFVDNEIILSVDSTFVPTVVVSPDKSPIWDNTSRDYVLVSSDETKCAVLLSKTLKGLAPGEVTVTAIATGDEAIKTEITVKVEVPAEFIGLDVLRTNIMVGESLDLSAIKYREGGEDKDVTFTSEGNTSTEPNKLLFAEAGYKTIIFSAVDRNSVTVTRGVSLRVYGDLTVTSTPATVVKLSDLKYDINDLKNTKLASILGITSAKDSFGTVLTKSIAVFDGEDEIDLADVVGGKRYKFVVSVSDEAGHNEVVEIDNLAVYDIPVLGYNTTAVTEMTQTFFYTLTKAFFAPVATDSFGQSLEVNMQAPTEVNVNNYYTIVLDTTDAAGNRVEIEITILINGI